MQIAGIDPSLTRTAICRGDGKEPPHVRVRGSSAVNANLFFRFERYVDLARWTLAEVKPARLIFLEGFSYGSKGAATVTLGEYGGVLRKTLLDAGMEIVEVAPSTLKKFVAGKGNAKKTNIASISTKLWGVVFDDEDEYFAHGLWRLGLAYCGKVECTTKAQSEVIAELKR